MIIFFSHRRKWYVIKILNSGNWNKCYIYKQLTSLEFPKMWSNVWIHQQTWFLWRKKCIEHINAYLPIKNWNHLFIVKKEIKRKTTEKTRNTRNLCVYEFDDLTIKRCVLEKFESYQCRCLWTKEVKKKSLLDRYLKNIN